MNQIILASHGGLSAGMKDTAQMILGELPHVHTVATTRDEKEDILTATRRLLDSFDPSDQVFILTDALGGSVNNDMLTLTGDYPHITIICGTNISLVIGLALKPTPFTREEVAQIIGQAKDQMLDCTEMIKKSSQEEDEL